MSKLSSLFMHVIKECVELITSDLKEVLYKDKKFGKDFAENYYYIK